MTRARDLAEWLPDGTPVIGQGISVASVLPRVRTVFAAGQIPNNALIHVNTEAPGAEHETDGVFWLNPAGPAGVELRVFLGGAWLQVALPEADAAGLLAMSQDPDHEWATTDELDGGMF